MINKILVAIDNSEMSQGIFREALELTQATHAQMMLLHVLSPFEDPYINPIYLQPEAMYPTLHTEGINSYIEVWNKLKQERLNWLRNLAQKATDAGVKAEFTQSLGDAGRVICEVAVNWAADVIIVGRRGHIGLSELFLGSISNYVLHHAPCSVLTLQGLIPVTQKAG